MEQFTTFTLPAKPGAVAAFTGTGSLKSGEEGQTLACSGQIAETGIQAATGAAGPPTVVRATAVLPGGDAELAVALPLAMGLSERKRLALRALAAGEGPRAAARAAGVNEGTLFRWRRHNANFIAALQAWQAESMKSAQNTLLVANELAAKVILQAVRNGNLKAALAVVKGLGTLTPRDLPEGFAPAVKKELSERHARRVLELGLESREWKNRLRKDAQKEKEYADAEARAKAERQRVSEADQKLNSDLYKRYYHAHWDIPPMPRPVTQKILTEWVKQHGHRTTMYATRVSVMVVAVKDDGAKFTEMLIKNWGLERAYIETALARLPWLLNAVIQWRQAEEEVAPMEQAGAVLELRPAWIA